MIQVEETEYGYRVVLSGFVCASDVRLWLGECETHLPKTSKHFHVLADLRTLKQLGLDAYPLMCDVQKVYKRYGMERFAVVFSNPMLQNQLLEICKESGVSGSERFFPISHMPDWPVQVANWLLRGEEPVEGFRWESPN